MTAPPFPAAAIAAVRDAAKAHLRVGNAGEDGVIATHAATAMALCEAFTGLSLVTRTWSHRLARDGRWQRLSAAPVVSIAAIAGGAIDIDAAGEGWARLPGSGDAASVDYVAGLATEWSGVPAPLAQGVTLLAAHLFDGRPDSTSPPTAITALWRPFRRIRLAAGERAA